MRPRSTASSLVKEATTARGTASRSATVNSGRDDALSVAMRELLCDQVDKFCGFPGIGGDAPLLERPTPGVKHVDFFVVCPVRLRRFERVRLCDVKPRMAGALARLNPLPV